MAAQTARRRATNLTLDADLVDEARALSVNVSQACEKGLADQVKQAREAKWLEENRDALEACNAWVARHGLPLAKYRMF